MHSTAKALGHPIHPMLVAFPVAFYAATAVAYGAHAAAGSELAFHVGVIANVAGVVSAVIAAIPGVIDWVTAVPSGHPAKRTGFEHMALNVASLALFAVAAAFEYRQWDEPAPSSGVGLALSVIGIGLTVGAGFLGWKLVQTHHVGVDVGSEKEQLDVAPRSRRADRPSIHATVETR